MAVVIAMLRGVNVGGHHKIKMEALRALYESAKARNVQTLGISGNVVFSTKERNLERLNKQVKDSIERMLGFRPEIVNRTTAELAEVIARNPFANRRDVEPGKLAVTFMAGDPSDEARATLRKMRTDPEELVVEQRELYIYFPNGMGRPNLSMPMVERILKIPATSRNWNTVTKLLAIADKLKGN